MCKHSNISIFEFGTAYTNHTLEGGVWFHDSGVGVYTGRIDVHCYDCGLEKTYHFRNRPKWLVRYLEEIAAPNTRLNPTLT